MAATPGNSIDAVGDRFIRIFWRKPATTLAEQTRRRVSVHLLPYLFFLYILAYLDRVNVSVAALGMKLAPEQGGLGFTDDVIGFGIGLFFWAYWILEIPSTLSVLKRGARWVFVRILVLWGMCATLVGFIGIESFSRVMFGWLPTLPTDIFGLQSIAHYVNELPTNSEYQFYFFRFALGFFEGGFFPAVIFYISIWFRQQDRAKAIALFMAAIPLSSAFGTPVSGLLLNVDWFGLDGWRWVFIVEGILPIIAGVTTIFLLPDNPRACKWLSDEERTYLTTELDREHNAKKGHGHDLGAVMSNLGMVLLLTFVYFCQNVSSYGMSTFMPSIFKEAVNSIPLFFQTFAENTPGDVLQAARDTQNQTLALILTTVTYALAFIGMMLNGAHSDRKNERLWHVAVPLALLGISVAITAALFQTPIVPVVMLVVFVGFFHYAHLPSFWPIPTMFLGSAAAASAIGFINMMGNLGGFVGPWMVGKKGADVSYSTALFKIAPWPIVAAAIILTVGLIRRRVPATTEVPVVSPVPVALPPLTKEQDENPYVAPRTKLDE